MECSQPIRDDRGYATPAAMVLCLAFAMVAIAMLERSMTLLRLTRLELETAQVSYVLSGAQLIAAAAVVKTAQPAPFHWTMETELGSVDIRAEPEQNKLTLADASELEDEFFHRFDVEAPALLRANLASAATAQDTLADVAGLDDAPLWRACAASVMSPLGQASQLEMSPSSVPTPGPGSEPPSWRIGETWRLAVTTKSGWRDDRLLRFTGDARRPVAVIARHLTRGRGDNGQCEAIISAMSGR